MVAQLKKYSSLDDALRSFRIPERNHEFIRRFVEAVGVAEFYETSGYIKCVRAAAGPDLHIASGWSNGFASEAEILDILGDVDRWVDDERARVWGVSHPENRIGHGGSGAAPREPRDYGVCQECFTVYAASGACNCL